LNWRKRFSVLSSDGHTIYYVDFVFSGDRVAVRCSCPAGNKGRFCKHKVLLLKNRSELLVENQQIDELSIMLCELRDQALFHELELLCQAEAIHDAAVVSLNEAKKRFEIVLRGE